MVVKRRAKEAPRKESSLEDDAGCESDKNSSSSASSSDDDEGSSSWSSSSSSSSDSEVSDDEDRSPRRRIPSSSSFRPFSFSEDRPVGSVLQELREKEISIASLPLISTVGGSKRRRSGQLSFHLDKYGNIISSAARPGSLCHYHIDHVVCRHDGGRTIKSNLSAIQYRANLSKGVKPAAKCDADALGALGIREPQLRALLSHCETLELEEPSRGAATSSATGEESQWHEHSRGAKLRRTVRRLLCRPPPTKYRFGLHVGKYGASFQGRFREFVEEVRTDAVDAKSSGDKGENDGELIFEYLDALVGGCKRPHREDTYKEGLRARKRVKPPTDWNHCAPRRPFKMTSKGDIATRTFWTPGEEEAFEKALEKFNGTKNKYTAILDDDEEGSWGKTYGVLGLRSNVHLKDKERNLEAARKDKRLRTTTKARTSLKVNWGQDEELLFLEALKAHPDRTFVKGVEGRWASILSDRRPGTWGAKYGVLKLRTSVHLKDKARTIKASK